MDMREVYLEGQKNCGLKPGDSVRILRQPKNREYGWCDMMPPKNYVGGIGVITCTTDAGMHVDFKNGDHYNYPYFVLEKVEDSKPRDEFTPFDKVLVRDTNAQTWEPAIYKRYAPALPYPHDTLNKAAYKQCIPYKGNEHLAFTTDSPEK